MFCRKCGQEQASESVLFCSSCGIKLNDVEEAAGIRLFKMAMYLLLVILAITGWGSITFGPNYMQIRIIIALVSIITFYLLFSRDLKYILHKLFSRNVGSEQSRLPAAESVSQPALGPHRLNTAEIVQPPSVTEQTTTLLDLSPQNRER